MSTEPNKFPLFEKLFSGKPEPRKKEPRFDGAEYDPDRDNVRLTGQQERIFNCMKDSRWRTLDEIANLTHDPQASISAQLRHLRKPRFGGHTVNRRARGDREHGLFEYQLIVSGQ